MDKEVVVHIQNGILLNKKECIWLSSNEVDETGAYYTEWNKSEIETPIQYINAYNGIQKDGNDDPICETAKETQMYGTVFWTLWEKSRVGWFERIAFKHVYYHMWNRSPAQVLCMIQGAQGWCTRMNQRDGMGREAEDGFRIGNAEHLWLNLSMYGKNY